MQRAAGHHRLEHFLRDEPEEERHADLVDRERERVREAEVALGGGVGPDQRDRGAERQQQEAIHRRSGRTRARRGDAGRGARDAEVWRQRMVCSSITSRYVVGRRWITPESTTRPVREIA